VSARPAAVLAALQAALTVRFIADPGLMELVGGRIHDGAPPGPVPPYLAFADMRTRDFSDGDGSGARAAITIEAFTADPDRARALAIVDRAAELALAGGLAPTEGALVLIRIDTGGVARLKDGRGWRAFVVLDALVDG
jgi:hypothetical protein